MSIPVNNNNSQVTESQDTQKCSSGSAASARVIYVQREFANSTQNNKDVLNNVTQKDNKTRGDTDTGVNGTTHVSEYDVSNNTPGSTGNCNRVGPHVQSDRSCDLTEGSRHFNGWNVPSDGPEMGQTETELQRKYAAARTMSELACGLFTGRSAAPTGKRGFPESFTNRGLPPPSHSPVLPPPPPPPPVSPLTASQGGTVVSIQQPTHRQTTENTHREEPSGRVSEPQPPASLTSAVTSAVTSDHMTSTSLGLERGASDCHDVVNRTGTSTGVGVPCTTCSPDGSPLRTTIHHHHHHIIHRDRDSYHATTTNTQSTRAHDGNSPFPPANSSPTVASGHAEAQSAGLLVHAYGGRVVGGMPRSPAPYRNHGVPGPYESDPSAVGRVEDMQAPVAHTPGLQVKTEPGESSGARSYRPLTSPPEDMHAENLCVRDIPPVAVVPSHSKQGHSNPLPLKKRKIVTAEVNDVTTSDDVRSAGVVAARGGAAGDTPPLPQPAAYHTSGQQKIPVKETKEIFHEFQRRAVTNGNVEYAPPTAKLKSEQKSPLDFSLPSRSKFSQQELCSSGQKISNLSHIVHRLSAQHDRSFGSKEFGVQLKRMALASFASTTSSPVNRRQGVRQALDLTSGKMKTENDSRVSGRGDKRQVVVLGRQGRGGVKTDRAHGGRRTELTADGGSGTAAAPGLASTAQVESGNHGAANSHGAAAAEPKVKNSSPLPINPQDSLRMLEECRLAVKADEDGDLPLHIAVVHGNSQTIRKLIDMMAMESVTMDFCNNLRQTPLHLAVITKQPDIIRTLLDHGASPDFTDRKGNSSVHLAIKHRSIPALQTLVNHRRCKPNLNSKNYEGLAPLHVAVQVDDAEVMRVLLRAGAAVNITDGKSGRTPLHHAVESRRSRLVQMLLEHHSKVNVQSYAGNTALHAASERNEKEIMALLVNYGADTTIKNANHETYNSIAKDNKQSTSIRESDTAQAALSGRASRTQSEEEEAPSASRRAGHKRGRTPRVQQPPGRLQDNPSPSPPQDLSVLSPQPRKSPRLVQEAEEVSGRDSRSSASPNSSSLQEDIKPNPGVKPSLIKPPVRTQVVNPAKTSSNIQGQQSTSSDDAERAKKSSALIRGLHLSNKRHEEAAAAVCAVIPASVASCSVAPVLSLTSTSQANSRLQTAASAGPSALSRDCRGDRSVIKQCGSPPPITSLATMVNDLHSPAPVNVRFNHTVSGGREACLQPRKVKVAGTVTLPGIDSVPVRLPEGGLTMRKKVTASTFRPQSVNPASSVVRSVHMKENVELKSVIRDWKAGECSSGGSQPQGEEKAPSISNQAESGERRKVDMEMSENGQNEIRMDDRESTLNVNESSNRRRGDQTSDGSVEGRSASPKQPAFLRIQTQDHHFSGTNEGNRSNVNESMDTGPQPGAGSHHGIKQETRVATAGQDGGSETVKVSTKQSVFSSQKKAKGVKRSLSEEQPTSTQDTPLSTVICQSRDVIADPAQMEENASPAVPRTPEFLRPLVICESGEVATRYKKRQLEDMLTSSLQTDRASSSSPSQRSDHPPSGCGPAGGGARGPAQQTDGRSQRTDAEARVQHQAENTEICQIVNDSETYTQNVQVEGNVGRTVSAHGKEEESNRYPISSHS